MTISDRDAGFMRVALGLARRVLGRVWPSPAVGCVIVSPAGELVGRGFTREGGRPHAEAVALDQAGGRARGATAYVTLEPCAHIGRGGPCSEALIAAGLARVVVAIGDPDPRVNGQGLEALREAGISVDLGCLADEAEALNQGFLTRVRLGRPMITLKLATSLDGRIATRTGESRWITGPAARAEVHLMRARADAVLVGAGTARDDDPKLNVRSLGIEGADPVRVVVTGSLALPRSGYLGRTAREAPLWLCHHPDAEPERMRAWAELGARLIELPVREEDDQIDLAAMARLLGELGLTRVLCEGGGSLAGALLAEDLVDELVCYTAGLVIGAEGLPGVGPIGIEALAAAPRFRRAEVAAVGADTRTRWIRDS